MIAMSLTLRMRARVVEAWQRLPQQMAERPTLMLFVCNVAAQMVGVCAAPLLARLYSPEQFGVLGAITAIVMVAVPLSSGRYELAIPRAATDAQSFTLLRLCITAIAIGCVVFGALSWLAASAGPAALSQVLAGYWYFVPLGIAFVGLYDVLGIEASRQNRLRPLALSKLSQVVGGVGSQLALGLVGWTSVGLLIGFVLNQAVGAGRLFKDLIATHPQRRPVPWRAVRAAAFEHRRYPLLAGWTSALDAAATWSLQLALTVLWSPQIGGFIFLTERLVGRPLLLLSSSLLPVYIANVSRALRDNPGDALAAFYTSLRRECGLTVVWTVAIVAIAPLAIGPLFGARWAGAVPYVQLMALALSPMVALRAVCHTLQLTGRQGLDAVLVTSKVAAIAVVVLGGHAVGWPALTTLAVYAAIQAVFALATFFCYRHALRIAGQPRTTGS